jgi:hypothetical protein
MNLLAAGSIRREPAAMAPFSDAVANVTLSFRSACLSNDLGAMQRLDPRDPRASVAAPPHITLT